MKKSECTPEQWERYCAKAREWYAKNKDQERAKAKARNQTEETKERRRAYDNTPERIAWRKEYNRQYGQRNKSRNWNKVKADPQRLETQYAKTRAWRTGMSAETFDALLLIQENRCAICNKDFTAKRKGERGSIGKGYACADHCHDGGGPRGLLCPTCNILEGHIKETGLPVQEFCDRLTHYLLNPPIKSVT